VRLTRMEANSCEGNAVGPNGNIGQRDIAREPLSMILNLGLSNNWVWIDWNQLG
jgi:beta-glucanase (GH16 family)